MNQFWFSFFTRNLPIPKHLPFGKTARAISIVQFTPGILTRKDFSLGKTGRPILVFESNPKNHQRKQFGLVTVAALWPTKQMHTLIGSLPKHQYVWVDTSFTHKAAIGFIPAVWFGLVSHPGRMWGCNVMLESGAIYRGLPLHALAHNRYPEDGWQPEHAQQWDCYGYGWTATEYTFLRSLRCKAKCYDREVMGEYLFTVAPVADGFSEMPEQAKEFMFIRTMNGRFTVQPTDRVIFEDKSFTTGMAWPVGLKRADQVYSCE